MSAQHISLRGSLGEYYFWSDVTYKMLCLSLVFWSHRLGNLHFCLLICRARAFLPFTKLLTQNPTMAEFYLGSSWMISRSAECCLGHPAATQGRPWSWNLTLKRIRKCCCWLWWQNSSTGRCVRANYKRDVTVRSRHVKLTAPAYHLHDITTDLDYKDKGGSRVIQNKCTCARYNKLSSGTFLFFNGLDIFNFCK